MPSVKVTLDLPLHYSSFPARAIVLAGPYSPVWKDAGIGVDVQTEGISVGLIPPSLEIVSFLIEWAGGEALTFVAGWVAHMLRMGVRVRVRGKQLPPASTEEDILDVLRAAQGLTDKRGGQ